MAGERKRVAEIKQRYYGRAMEILDRLRAAGRLRRRSLRVAVLSLFGMMNWTYTWHRPQVDPGADDLARTTG